MKPGERCVRRPLKSGSPELRDRCVGVPRCRTRAPAMTALRLRSVGMTATVAAIASLSIFAPPQSIAFGASEPAVARFTWSAGQPPPKALYVAPTSIRFGDVLAVVIELEPGAAIPSADALRVDVDWLVPASGVVMPELGDLPPASGPRLVVPMHIYHLGAWRAAWGEAEPGEVMIVAGRLSGSESIMPVRDPRPVGGIPRWVPWVLGLAAALAGGLLWRRRWLRRGSGLPLADRPLAPPAWLAAALQLQELDATPALGEQSGRAFLDRLAHILRTYVQERYHLPALELTANELVLAGRAAGWPPEQIGAFRSLLDTCDRERYAPSAVTSASCRQFLGMTLDLIEDVRIEPVWSFVPPGLLAEATAAWRRLRTRYPRETATRERTAC